MRRLCMVIPLILLFASWICPLLPSESDAETLEWVRRYSTPNGDAAHAIALDAEGNVYVTGGSSKDDGWTDYATIKYSPDGVRLWVIRYSGPGNGDDDASAIAVDAEGNVYITGKSEGAESMTDYATIKYSPDGVRLWVKRYNGPGNSYDVAEALALDREGNVYVTGTSVGGSSGFDYTTIKYGPTGDRLWVRRYNGPANNYDAATALAVDGEGNVCVTGYSVGDGGSYDITTLKYSPSGELIWGKRYNGPGNGADRARAIAVDAAGNVYVTGRSVGIDSSEDYATIKYSPAGVRLWTKRYNGPGNADDQAHALAVDAGGNVYVTGQSAGVGSSGPYEPMDYATLKYSPAGVQLWEQRYNGPGEYYDTANAIAVDAQGNVFVTGQAEGVESSSDYATIKYSQESE